MIKWGPHRLDMRPSLFAAMCRHLCANCACVLQSDTASNIVARLSRKLRILLLLCIGRNVQHHRGLDYVNLCIFDVDIVPKTILTFSSQWSWLLIVWPESCSASYSSRGHRPGSRTKTLGVGLSPLSRKGHWTIWPSVITHQQVVY